MADGGCGGRAQAHDRREQLQALLDAKAAVTKARDHGATALDPDLLADLRQRYDKATTHHAGPP